MDEFEIAKQHFLEGLSLLGNENFLEAEARFLSSLQLIPDRASTLTNLAATQIKLGKYDDARISAKRALSIDTANVEAWLNLGLAEMHSQNAKLSIEHFDEAIRLKPDYSEAWLNRGTALGDLQCYDEALASYDQAIRLRPDLAAAWLNKGALLNRLRRFGEALLHHDRAILLKADLAEAWLNKGVALVGLRRHNDALACYDEAIRRKQNYAEAWSNKGVALHELERHEEALSHFDRAIELNADYVEPWSNKALTLHKLRRFAEALVHCDRAIQLNADFAEAWANKGLTLNDLGRHDEAMAHYECAYRLKPGMDFVLGHLVHTQMVLCDWKGFDLNVSELARKVAMGEPATVPFSLLSAIDSPDLHLKAAQTWVNGRYPGNLSLPAITKSKNQKIRVGYFSADFRHHPVAILTAELFELHDRDRFEIFAFSFGETTQGDEMRKRLVGAFDQFIDVKNRSDADIAQLSRSLNIDIAVDLGGHTKDSRTAIFSHRAAPVQVSYLGYAGSMGAGYIDYLIADRVVVPDSNRQYYAEKIAYLPNSFMVDDSKRQAAQGQPGRTQFGLPATGIVFCCFNNSYKITPEIFGIWLNILAKVDGSVLWLSGSNDWSRENLKSEARQKGIDPGRLIFAERLDDARDHLARHRLADLFLDTLPYNAHTTAVDALRSGLPVLTILGKAFAGRVAASLLTTLDLPELITSSPEEYQSAAIEFGNSPEKLGQIRDRLAANRLSTPLFKTPLYARHLEAAFAKMYARSQASLLPDHIFVDG